MSIWSHIEKSLTERVLILDGAMGTMLQVHGFKEADFRGAEFAQWPQSLKGNNDLLNLTRPQAVISVHDGFLAAGADFIETNTFNATPISQADYGLQDQAGRIAKAGAKLARAAADDWTKQTPHKPRAVLGAIGPLNKTLSMSPKVEDPGWREVDFDTVVAAYRIQILAMFDHVDALLIETVFDTLNAKAAIHAAFDVFEDKGAELPLMISGTITDLSGRTLSGQTVQAFWHSIAHADPFAVGLNCALGADTLTPYVRELARIADTHVLAYPNAGLPNAFGAYDETPTRMGQHMQDWFAQGLVNIVGGCCGTTPDHIARLAQLAETATIRQRPQPEPALQLSGLEGLKLHAS